MNATLRLVVTMAALLAVVSPQFAYGQAVPALSDTLIDFGGIPFPLTGTKDFTVYNVGDAPLFVLNIFADDWVKFTAEPISFTVEPGDSQIVTASYSPGDIVSDSTAYNIVSYIGQFDTLRVPARGYGTVNIPQIEVSADTAFAIVPNNTVGEAIIIISNVGGGFVDWEADEPTTSGFVTLVPSAGRIPWLQSRELRIEMGAGSLQAGDYFSMVRVTSNDISNPSIDIVVQMRVQGRPVIETNPNPINFGTVFVGFTADWSLSVKNVGTEDLVITDVVSSRPELVAQGTSRTIAPGNIWTLPVSITPPTVGSFTGSLTIHNDDPLDPLHVVNVQAQVSDTPPSIVVDTDTIAVTLPYTGTEQRSLFIGNAGDFDLQFGITESADWLLTIPSGGIVSPGFDNVVQVRFTADQSAGEYTTDLTINSNDPANSVVQIPTRMTVLSAITIGVSDTALVFGSRFVGLEDTQSLTITNSGNAPLVLTNVSVNSPGYVLGNVPASIPAEGAADIDVTFRPPFEGPFDGLLVIENNSQNNDSVVVALSGLGVVPIELQVLSPDSIAAAVGQAAWASANAWIANPSSLDQPILMSSYIRGGSPAPRPAAPPAPRVRNRDSAPLSPWESAGDIPPLATGAPARAAAVVGTPTFYDNFEDLDMMEWTFTSGTGVKEIVGTGFNSSFALRESNAANGHSNGVYMVLPDVQPREVAFAVQPGQDDKFSNYVTIRDDAGREVIFFFAMSTGVFYVNANVGGHQSYAYNAGQWYLIEYRDIDWTAKTFDYYVDDDLVQADISFRNDALVDEFARVDLYSFSAGANAWWDNIWFDWGQSPEWLTYSPLLATIGPSSIAKLQLRMSSTGLPEGMYEAYLGVRTNNAVETLLTIPVTMVVDSTVTGIDDGTAPNATALHQNYPNPFNPTTTITFDVHDDADVSLYVYGVAGARVRTLVARNLPTGHYTSSWDGTDDSGRRVASGIYFYRLDAGDFTATRKMVLLK